MRSAFRALKDHATSRGIDFCLTFPYFRRFALQTDYLNRTGSGGQCLTVDRKDNLRGYVPGNIQALTREQNSIKQAKRDAIRMKSGFAWTTTYESNDQNETFTGSLKHSRTSHTLQHTPDLKQCNG